MFVSFPWAQSCKPELPLLFFPTPNSFSPSFSLFSFSSHCLSFPLMPRPAQEFKCKHHPFVDWQWAPPLIEVGLCLRTSASSPHLVSLALADKSYTLVCSSWHWCLLARQPAAYPGPLEALSVPSLPSEAERSGHRLQASGSLKSSCLCEPGAHLHAWHCQGHIRWRRGKVWSVGRFIMGQLFACWRGSSDAAPGHPRLQFKKLTRTYFGSWIGFALLERSMLFLASSCWIGKGQVHEIRASLCLCPSVVIWDKCKVFVRNVQSVSILGKNWYT